MDQNRFKSPVVWAAVVAQILTVLIVLDVINVAQQETINQVVAAVLQLLVAFGVINNPRDAENFYKSLFYAIIDMADRVAPERRLPIAFRQF